MNAKGNNIAEIINAKKKGTDSGINNERRMKQIVTEEYCNNMRWSYVRVLFLVDEIQRGSSRRVYAGFMWRSRQIEIVQVLLM